MPRAAVAVTLPGSDFAVVFDDLAAAGFDAIRAATADDLEQLLRSRDDVRVAILDGETDLDRTLEMYAVLHDGGRNVGALILVPPTTLGRMSVGGRHDLTDEYFARPFSAESLRWRVEAMLIRSDNVLAEDAAAQARTAQEARVEADRVEEARAQEARVEEARVEEARVEEARVEEARVEAAPFVDPTLAEGTQGPAGPSVEAATAGKLGRLIVVFNPKGGVGKTTVSINVGSALQLRKHLRVLIVDCDTVTGHVASSLGLGRPGTLADAWREDDRTGTSHSFAQVAIPHPSGLHVLVLATNPLHTEVLEP
ncbi:MAG: CpaE family protein, partial [Candidatus Limnocylindrales bacterium]